MLPLEFVVSGVPASVQASGSSKARWKAQVSAAAQAALPSNGQLISHNVHVQIVFYYTGAPLDTDNMLKPILDAMNGIVYVDDTHVSDIRAAKRSLDGQFRVRGMSLSLAQGFSSGTDFVHVRIEHAPGEEELL